MQTVVPMLAYEDGTAAIEWLTRAFGFRENEPARISENGVVSHAELDVGDGSLVFLATPTPDYESPKHHRKNCEAARKWSAVPWVIDGLMVQVEDVDAHCSQARTAGADVLRELEEVEAAGIRLYTAEDLEGHRWMFTQAIGDR
ncbi:MAG: aminotransferase [Actinomycetota bacterium]|nr:aminotransferase [Actinomycetota bacterium]